MTDGQARKFGGIEDMAVSFLQLDHGLVQVDSIGDGPELVIIHSLLTGPEAFEQVAVSLSGRRAVHRLYLPGFGRSTPLNRSEISIADLSDIVASAMEALGCGPDTTVLGNGLGSFVALSLAIDHGEVFDKLIASNTGMGFPEGRRGAFLVMSDLAREGGMVAVADVAIQRIFPPGYLERHPEAAGERRRVLEGVDPGAFAAACRALSILELEPRMAAIGNSTLVIGGEIDQTTPPEMGRAAAAAIPDARYAQIPGCGHCPQLERPEALLEMIDGFLTEPATL